MLIAVHTNKLCKYFTNFLRFLYFGTRLKHINKYEGCLLYFGIREQIQILIIENRYIVFQNIPH